MSNYSLSIYFGVPGAGKTTLAAKLAKTALRKHRHVYSNVPITGTFQLNAKTDVGQYLFDDNALIIIDEAGIEYNNRDFKSFPESAVYYYKYHRHYRNDVVVFSQSFDDMDITLRRLAQRYYIVKKSLLPWTICFKRIGKRIGINDETKQIIDEYFWKPLGTRWVFSHPLWKLFNSYSHKKLPNKIWYKW